MHILVYTSQYRMPNETFGAPFTTQLLSSLRERARVSLICPVPWAPNLPCVRSNPRWRDYVGAPSRTEIDGQEVNYCRYPMLPRVSGYVQPALQLLSSFSRAKSIHRLAPIDVINGRFVYPDGVAATWIGKKLGIPVVLTALGGDINVYAAEALRRAQIQWALRNAAYVTAVSKELAEKLIHLGADEGKVGVSNNAVDVELFHPCGPLPDDTENRPEPGHRCILAIGRLVSVKGLPTLIEAIEVLRNRGLIDFETVIIGDGPDRKALEEMVEARGLRSSIRFIGAIVHSDIAKWMRLGHVVCQPSTQEGTPNSILEAIATGLPVVASRVGGIPDVVDKRNGALFEPGDAEGLADALAQVLAQKWDRWDVRSTIEHLTWKAEASWYIDQFARVLSK